MIAIDTNVLVYAHRQDSEWHKIALETVREMAEAPSPWAVPWPCIHEFSSIVTNHRIWKKATPLEIAVDQVDAWFESPRLVLLAEGGEHWSQLRSLLLRGKVQGPKVHDARIAALCQANGVRELWTADRDFGLFPSLATRNPLVP